MKRALALSAALAALSMTTGCGFASGALFGALVGGEEDPWMMEPVPVNGELGTSVVCLGVDQALDEEVDLDGLVVRGRYKDVSYRDDRDAPFDNLVPCWQEPEYAFRLEDAQGRTWTVGFAWLASDGWDMTPWPSAYEGDPVELLFRADPSEGSQAAGFVLKSRGEFSYALESGRDGRALLDGDIPGVEFRSDRVVTTTETECGDRATLAQDFVAGASSLTLYPGEDQGFEVDGDYLTTCSIDSWRMEEGDGCEDDLVAESSFVMFR